MEHQKIHDVVKEFAELPRDHEDGKAPRPVIYSPWVRNLLADFAEFLNEKYGFLGYLEGV